MLAKILPTAKAWCALLGAIATALLGSYGPETQVGHVLTIIVAVATAVVVFAVPNTAQPAHRAERGEQGVIDVGTAIVIAVLCAVLLLLVLIIVNHPGVLR